MNVIIEERIIFVYLFKLMNLMDTKLSIFNIIIPTCYEIINTIYNNFDKLYCRWENLWYTN